MCTRVCFFLKCLFLSLFDLSADKLLPPLPLPLSLSLPPSPSFSLESEVECRLSEGVHSESALERPEWRCTALLPFPHTALIRPHPSRSDRGPRLHSVVSYPPISPLLLSLMSSISNPRRRQPLQLLFFNVISNRQMRHSLILLLFFFFNDAPLYSIFGALGRRNQSQPVSPPLPFMSSWPCCGSSF